MKYKEIIGLIQKPSLMKISLFGLTLPFLVLGFFYPFNYHLPEILTQLEHISNYFKSSAPSGLAGYLKFLDGKLQCFEKNDYARNEKHGVIPQQEIYNFISVPLFKFSATWVTQLFDTQRSKAQGWINIVAWYLQLLEKLYTGNIPDIFNNLKNLIT